MWFLPSFQDIIPDYDGDHYGVALCVVGDVDGDGIADFAVGETSAGTRHSLVDLRSGATSRLIWRRETERADARTYVLEPAGDIDHDGVPDLLFGTPSLGDGCGAVRVLSGRDGHTLLTLRDGVVNGWFGVSLAGDLDFDRDGTPDIVVGAPGPFDEDFQRVGHIHVHSGHDGSELLDIRGSKEMGLGWQCTAGVDLDSDGVPDIVAASVGSNGWGKSRRGSLRWSVLSGRDGTWIQELFDADDRPRDPGRVSVVSDPRGGPARIVTSCFAYDDESRRGAVQVFSATSPQVLLHIEPDEPGGNFGLTMTTSSDVDGDGVKDIVVGSPDAAGEGLPGGEVTAWSGVDGHRIWRLPGRGVSNLGATLAGGLDVDGDCCEDVLAGAVWVGGGWEPAYVVVISGRTGKELQRIERSTL